MSISQRACSTCNKAVIIIDTVAADSVIFFVTTNSATYSKTMTNHTLTIRTANFGPYNSNRRPLTLILMIGDDTSFLTTRFFQSNWPLCCKAANLMSQEKNNTQWQYGTNNSSTEEEFACPDAHSPLLDGLVSVDDGALVHHIRAGRHYRIHICTSATTTTTRKRNKLVWMTIEERSELVR